MGRQRVLAQGEATPSAWRAKVTALKDDDFVPSSKKEKKERKYMYHIMLGFHGYEWGVELSFKALFELNQAIAEDIPGYLSVAFPPKRLLKRKGKTKQGEKRRGLLEQWVTELLTATEVSALSPVVDLLEIPNDVMGWVRREEEARGNTEHPAHLSAENTLFVDVGSDQGTAAAHLAHAAVSLAPGAAPFAPPGASPLAPQLSAMTSPLYTHCYTGVLASYGQNFDNSEATRPDFGPGPAPGPKTAGLLDLGVEGYASLLQGLCSTHKAEVDLIDPAWRSIKYTPKQSKPRERKGSMAADPQGGVPGLGVDPRARGTYGQGGGQGKAAGSPRAPTMAGRLAAGPEMQPRGRGKEAAFAYDSATGAVRDVGRQRMCPVFLELHGHLKMTVLALDPTMPARDVVAMLFGRNAGLLGGEDPESWSLYERRVQREGIFERPFGDDQPIKKLWAYPRFPELRCRRNTTKAAYDTAIKKPVGTICRGPLLHLTHDAGWQRTFAKCGTADPLPKIECFKDPQFSHTIGSIPITECSLFYWTSVSSTVAQQWSFVLIHRQASGAKNPFFFAAYSRRDLDRWFAHLMAIGSKDFYRPLKPQLLAPPSLGGDGPVSRPGNPQTHGGVQRSPATPRRDFEADESNPFSRYQQVLRDESNPFSVVAGSSTNPFRRTPASEPAKSRAQVRRRSRANSPSPAHRGNRRSDGSSSPFSPLHSQRSPSSRGSVETPSGLRQTEPPLLGVTPSHQQDLPRVPATDPAFPRHRGVAAASEAGTQHPRSSNPFVGISDFTPPLQSAVGGGGGALGGVQHSGSQQRATPPPLGPLSTPEHSEPGRSATTHDGTPPAASTEGRVAMGRVAVAEGGSRVWVPANASPAPTRRRAASSATEPPRNPVPRRSFSSTLPNTFGLDKTNPFYTGDEARGAPSTVPRATRARRSTESDGVGLGSAEQRRRRNTNPFLLDSPSPPSESAQ
eukprot:m.320220 g.320220  ORF g.320220 m.320220 type:complete len:962 (-) comp16450_c0_seq2:124-3009(-)